MNAEQQALVERWRGFLSKIDERLAGIVSECEAGVAGLTAQSPDDAMPISQAMTGLDHRIRQLDDKIEETWDGQVEDKFSDGGDGDFLDVGLDMKRDAELALEAKWTLWKAKALGDFYRQMWPRAQAAMAEPLPCTQCGTPLSVPTPHQSHTVPCPSCAAVNQIIPKGCIQQYFGGGSHAFAEELALPIRFEIERYREEVDRWRRARDWAPETIESMDKWHEMEVRYWRTYSEAKAKMLHEPVDEEYVESRLAQFRKYNLENDQRWRKAKGL